MENNLQVTINYGGKCYSGGCHIRGRELVFDIPGLGQWATDAALADHKLGEAARLLAGLLLPHLIKERMGSYRDEPVISLQEESISLQGVV